MKLYSNEGLLGHATKAVARKHSFYTYKNPSQICKGIEMMIAAIDCAVNSEVNPRPLTEVGHGLIPYSAGEYLLRAVPFVGGELRDSAYTNRINRLKGIVQDKRMEKTRSCY
ncbi:hypothetical protein HOK51_04560 [Candidatus Woesearchaeota archaeon]|nr:hypothetical protein [Candidatus Woesearchaeota archaeon]MBT6519096.1 hypothetical protein [Candidatus Woesearchaeota archaeon]MBT7367039.1 hypothetical protein [Candidatus Woesearchaeota archaeon]